MIRFEFRHTLVTFHSSTLHRADNVSASLVRISPPKAKAFPTACLFMLPLLALSTAGWAKRSEEVQEIPFKLYRNHLVVVVGSLGRLEQKNLLIDTGTNPTVVDEATAQELGLEQIDQSTVRVNVVDAMVPTYYSILPKLGVGPLSHEAMRVAVSNLSWLHDQAGIRVDAVIGLDVLSQVNFQIDYQSKRISFGAIRVPRWAVPMVSADHLLMVQAKLNGIPAELMVDTGGSSLVLFAEKLPKSGGWQTLGTKVTFSNLAGHTALQKVLLKGLRIGETDLSGTIALVADTPACCDFQGILGISGRQFKRITFDFKRHLVGFELQATNVADSFGTSACEASFEPPLCGTVPVSPRAIMQR
jgi:predicted aspartyl protease